MSAPSYPTSIAAKASEQGTPTQATSSTIALEPISSETSRKISDLFTKILLDKTLRVTSSTNKDTSLSTVEMINQFSSGSPAESLVGVLTKIIKEKIPLDTFAYMSMLVKVSAHWDLVHMLSKKIPKQLCDANFYQFYIQTAMYHGKAEEAITAYQEALTNGDTGVNEEIFLKMLSLYFKKEDFVGAWEVYKKAKERKLLSSQVESVFVAYANYYVCLACKNENFSVAEKAYKCLENNQINQDTHLSFFLCASQTNHPDEAFSTYQVLDDARKNYPSVIALLIHVKGKNGGYLLAKAFYQKAVDKKIADESTFLIMMDLSIAYADFSYTEKVHADAENAQKTTSSTYANMLSIVKQGGRLHSLEEGEGSFDAAKRIFLKAKAEEKADIQLYNLMMEIAAVYQKLDYVKELFEETKEGQLADKRTCVVAIFAAGIAGDRAFAHKVLSIGRRNALDYLPQMVFSLGVLGTSENSKKAVAQRLQEKRLAKAQISSPDAPSLLPEPSIPPAPISEDSIAYANHLFNSLEKKCTERSPPASISSDLYVAMIILHGSMLRSSMDGFSEESFEKMITFFEKALTVHGHIEPIYLAALEAASMSNDPKRLSFAEKIFQEAKKKNIVQSLYDKMIDVAGVHKNLALVRKLVEEAKKAGVYDRKVCDAHIHSLVQNGSLAEAIEVFTTFGFSLSDRNNGYPLQFFIRQEKTGTYSLVLHDFSFGTALVIAIKFFTLYPNKKLLIKLGQMRTFSFIQSHQDERYPVGKKSKEIFSEIMKKEANRKICPNLQLSVLGMIPLNLTQLYFTNRSAN